MSGDIAGAHGVCERGQQMAGRSTRPEEMMKMGFAILLHTLFFIRGTIAHYFEWSLV